MVLLSRRERYPIKHFCSTNINIYFISRLRVYIIKLISHSFNRKNNNKRLAINWHFVWQYRAGATLLQRRKVASTWTAVTVQVKTALIGITHYTNLIHY